MRAISKRRVTVAAGVILAIGLGVTAPVAWSQQKLKSESETISGKLKVKAIDKAKHYVTVTNAKNETFELEVSPQVGNLDKIKVGDTINATYTAEVGLLLSPPGAPAPANSEQIIQTRAAKGELPSKLIKDHVAVTGEIIAIDKTKHTMTLVSPSNGQVHNIVVEDAENQKAMAKLKAGDKLTVYVTRTLALAVTPG